jgi:plasmid stabilization system protein ParE
VKVRFTRQALRQMVEILDYIEARSPQGAENVKRRLGAVIGLLADHPDTGQVTNKGKLRRVVVSPYPYVIFYQLDTTGVVIHGVRHAARRPL